MDDLNGELDTSEFFVTCLKEDEDRRGDSVASTEGSEGPGDDLRGEGEVRPSRLFI